MTVRRIVLAVDFSETSARAVEAAIDLARSGAARVDAIHAYHMPALIGMPDEVAIPSEFWAGIREAARTRLEDTLRRIREAGIEVEGHLLEDSPSEAIVALARKVGADLIVMGTRGLTGLRHVLLGSVAERTLRHAPCSVLVVRPKLDAT